MMILAAVRRRASGCDCVVQAFRTEELRWLVLDEADRLLDLGFEQKIGVLCCLHFLSLFSSSSPP